MPNPKALIVEVQIIDYWIDDPEDLSQPMMFYVMCLIGRKIYLLEQEARFLND